MDKNELKQQVLSYMRMMYEEDPELSQVFVDELGDGLGYSSEQVSDEELQAVLDELVTEGKVEKKEHRPPTRPTYEAIGGKMVWD
jgi:hypothetical protein